MEHQRQRRAQRFNHTTSASESVPIIQVQPREDDTSEYVPASRTMPAAAAHKGPSSRAFWFVMTLISTITSVAAVIVFLVLVSDYFDVNSSSGATDMIVTAGFTVLSIFVTIHLRKTYRLKKHQSRVLKQNKTNRLTDHYPVNNYQEPLKPEFVAPLETIKHNYATFDSSRIHEDIQGLLWIVGENYTQTLNKRIQIDASIYPALNITFSSEIEPSLINKRDKAAITEDISTVETPPYYPCYAQLTPLQKGVYWQLLEDPYDPRIDIGYVFILYYGLERHLLLGDYERAFSVILKLRQVHSDRSFQSYSRNALMLACMYRKRPDLAMEFIDAEDNVYESKLSDNLYLLCKFTLKLPMTAVNIMRLHKSFEFATSVYISRYAELFEDNLIAAMEVKYGKDRLYITDIVTTKAKAKANIKPVNTFANMSIADRSINIPALAENFHLKRDIYELLMTALETTKQEVSSSRRKG